MKRNLRFLKFLSIVLALYYLGGVTTLAGQNRSFLNKKQRNKEIAKIIARFSRFIDWPEQSNIKDSSQPFIIGVLGDNNQLENFRQYYSKQRIYKKVVVIIQIDARIEIKNCNLVFFSKSDKRNHSQILTAIGKIPVLTIGDNPGFLRQGGHIKLSITSHQVKFAVSITALKNSGLKASHHLLNLSEQSSERK